MHRPFVPAAPLSLFAWPGFCLRVRRIVGDVWVLILPDGAFPMARKKPVKKKASPRSVRPPSAKPPLSTHPRLIHGFLIRLATKTTIPAEEAKPEFAAVVSAKVPAQRLSDTKPEGPVGGETFH